MCFIPIHTRLVLFEHFVYMLTIIPLILHSDVDIFWFLILQRLPNSPCKCIYLYLTIKFHSLSLVCNVASLYVCYKYSHSNCSDGLFSSVPRLYEFNRATRLEARSQQLQVEMVRFNCKLCRNSLVFRTSRLCHSLPTSFSRQL